MEPFDRARNMSSILVQPFSFHSSNHLPPEPSRDQSAPSDSGMEDKSEGNVAFMKGPKRKRLAKVSTLASCLPERSVTI